MTTPEQIKLLESLIFAAEELLNLGRGGDELITDVADAYYRIAELSEQGKQSHPITPTL
jgi:hypothetical protein